jgi:hypothetical protein
LNALFPANQCGVQLDGNSSIVKDKKYTQLLPDPKPVMLCEKTA